MERTKLHYELFDHRHPTAKQIQERYKPRDLSEMAGLTRADIADAILHLTPGHYLILPELGWENDVYSNPFRRFSVPLDTPARFRKFAPEIDVVKSGITLKKIRERQLTPRSAFRALEQPEVREKLRKGNYRGVGWWSPRSRRHNILWFDVLAEGQEYARMFEDDFDTEYLFADAYQHVPSFSREDRVYITPLKVLPVTPGQACIEWLETFAQCGCEDSFYMGAKTKKKADDAYEALYKYVNPEQIICRHNWAQRKLVEKASREGRTPLRLLLEWPNATGLLNYWLTLKTKTLIRGRRLRRPLKTEINILCGNGIGYAGVSYMLDLSE